MKKKFLSKNLISSSTTIRQAIKKMSESGQNFCIFVNNKKQVEGIFTEGDFRKAVYTEIKFDDKVEKLVNKNFFFLRKNFTKNEVVNIFNNSDALQIPVLNKKKKLIEIIFRESYKKNILQIKKNSLSRYQVIIMAGGKGKRLDPFTRILPKALIPLDDEPIIHLMIKKFSQFGVKDFTVSINNKNKMVKSYLDDLNSNYKISYLIEKKPLGTVGALGLIKKKLKQPFFLVNCDTIIDSDYSSIMNFHKKNNHDITLVGAMQNYKIPFGVCDVDTKGRLKSFREKPNLDYVVNSGFYVCNPRILKNIPKNQNYDFTNLMQSLIKKKYSIGVYPVSEESWTDIGQYSTYKKALLKLQK